jgi:sarcosine oxidase subunit alpha
MRRRRGPFRLETGGQIDRARVLAFRFDGKTYAGHPGDTLASALLANGVRTVARSFKFHRPRGIFTCGIEEPNALLQVSSGARAILSARAPVVELLTGLEAFSQEGWPALRFDLGRALDVLSSFWAAGFYNKTFIWPNWQTYEGVIRRLAGLGRAPREPDPARYDVRHLHCDVLVVGGGSSGLKAALDASAQGARVVLAEQDVRWGGRAAWDGETPKGDASNERAEDAARQLAHRDDAQVLTRTTAVGYYDHNVVTLLERVRFPREGAPRERYWIVRADRVVLATGTVEQPLVFSHNDRPGIFLASAARQYLRRYGVALGSRVLIATNNDSAYALAQDLTEHGVTVLGVIDSRNKVPDPLRRSVRALGVDAFPRSIPIDTAGFSALRKVSVGRLSRDVRSIEEYQTFKCDALAVSGGFSPALHLFAQAGGKLTYDENSGALRPVAPHPCIEIVGAAAQATPIGPRVSPVGKTHRQWVDLLHDVTVADLELALRENYTSVEHVKRYTTVGMAADQGKTSTPVTLDVLSRLRGVPASLLGHTTQRPPVTPVTLGAIAGREVGERFAPIRRLPMHDWHVRHGALMQDFAGWQRAVTYLRSGESREEAASREALAVRTAAGLFDGSSVGKIEINGPDALEFLDRFYINNLKTLPLGRLRYGLMLRETGVIFDDGTVVALAPDHLVITTTSGNAHRVHQWLEEWHQCEWPHLQVAITPVTEQWATLSLAGPKARTILAKLDTDILLSGEAFPHLTMRRGSLLGLPARIYRVSFTGELTYEINVPADSGQRLWETLLDVGAPEGLLPFGMDALMSLRLEKGFLHVGSDTDGTTVPDDVGWGRIASHKTVDYIGRRSLSLPEHVRLDRLQLVGLRSISSEEGRTARSSKSRASGEGTVPAIGLDELYAPSLSVSSPAVAKPLTVGGHLRLDRSANATDGWITSAGATVFGRVPVGLALLRGGRHYVGHEVTVFDGGVPLGRAQIINPPFYNPGGERMNA